MKNHPVKAQSPDHPGSVILSKEPSHQVLLSSCHCCIAKLNYNLKTKCFSFGQADFSRHVGSLSKAQVKKVARFLPNPEKHWGPKVRAGRQITSKHVSLIGHEAVNSHLNGHKEAGGEEGEEEEKEGNIEDEPDMKRQKITEVIASSS